MLWALQLRLRYKPAAWQQPPHLVREAVGQLGSAGPVRALRQQHEQHDQQRGFDRQVPLQQGIQLHSSWSVLLMPT